MSTMKYLGEKNEVRNEILILWTKRTKKKQFNPNLKSKTISRLFHHSKLRLALDLNCRVTFSANNHLVVVRAKSNWHISPRLTPATWFLFAFRLAHFIQHVCCDWPITRENISIRHVFSKYSTRYLAHVVVLMVRAFLVKRHCFLGDHLALQEAHPKRLTEADGNSPPPKELFYSIFFFSFSSFSAWLRHPLEW